MERKSKADEVFFDWLLKTDKKILTYDEAKMVTHDKLTMQDRKS